MRFFLAIAHTGVTALLLHPLRSGVTVAALVAVLLPYLACLGISRGVQREAETAVRKGADLYASARQFGRPVPIPLEIVSAIEKIDGVHKVIPRIMGGIVLGKDGEHAVLVGLPPDNFPSTITCLEGNLPSEGSVNELVIGTELARRFHFKIGDTIPYFYRNRKGERLSKVVGIFKSDVSLWQANLIFTTLPTASAIFDQPGLVTDILIYCRPGNQAAISHQVFSLASTPNSPSGPTLTFHVTGKEDLEALLPRGLLHREGIFNLIFILAFAVGIAVTLVTSGVGLSERRREIGILKATGWQTDEILLRGLVESFLLSLAGASISLLLAFLWLRGFNGYWIAGIFLTGLDARPSFTIPFLLTPVPALFAFLISFVVVMSGTLYSSWRAAIVPPLTAMR